MAPNRLRGLPLIALGLLFLAGCQDTQNAPSDVTGRVVDGAANRCRGDSSVAAFNSAKNLFPDNERQRLAVDICQDIMDGRVDADLGADQLHVLAYQGWKNGNLGSATAQDLADFNAAVRGLSPVALLDSDEQPEWTLTNIGDDQFLAVGPTTASDIHCFGEIDTVERWCFQVVAGGDSYFFLAEAKAPTAAGDLGACPGPLASDCEDDVVHIDVNPDEAIDDDDDNTFVNVWSCTDFATRHARFGVGPDGFGDPGPPVPAGLGNCGESSSALSGMQRWVWAGLQPLRWVAGVEALTAGGTGTTFARGSDVAAGEFGSIRVRDIVCRTTARFASVS
ncbi:MAG TPA: hypothetical protein VJP59_00980, partial [Gemmatimonadota bacterium]|nr:hypothetical protein [Gemmatimonadota bacterium]